MFISAVQVYLHYYSSSLKAAVNQYFTKAYVLPEFTFTKLGYFRRIRRSSEESLYNHFCSPKFTHIIQVVCHKVMLYQVRLFQARSSAILCSIFGTYVYSISAVQVYSRWPLAASTSIQLRKPGLVNSSASERTSVGCSLNLFAVQFNSQTCMHFSIICNIHNSHSNPNSSRFPTDLCR